MTWPVMAMVFLVQLVDTSCKWDHAFNGITSKFCGRSHERQICIETGDFGIQHVFRNQTNGWYIQFKHGVGFLVSPAEYLDDVDFTRRCD